MNVRLILLNKLNVDALTPQMELDIEQVCQQVKNYCHITEIPEELNFTVAEMIMDLQRERTGEKINFTDANMGDTSYSFDADNSIDGLLRDYKTDLQRFRKLRW